ncbi:sensor domain-containing diguanylate cyclase [Desulfovibrio sulfodismutans]|uniref:diguanylate cyclase n=1 Tax=Desulfolutivibrio sulfodismutans TaxID=63561 RepID=A0A7K3NQ03_9BACT|nr:sensor domain-containing diguanylate cyclase [Desulfolutivibrio sulfodismutans]NDY58286.1 sensor domain-containing diguanylate cyclase [Desulfolutivibrio sulfodismutans]QLA12629.1 diguanylate cyclase [Desulfolutivibrio sulfodismutans DSM 3696]
MKNSKIAKDNSRIKSKNSLQRSTEVGKSDVVRKLIGEVPLQTKALQNAIFNSVNFSCIATDSTGLIQIFNVGAENLLGFKAEEVVDKFTPADLSDPQEISSRAMALSTELNAPISPGFEALVFKASRGIEDIYELTYIRKDQSRFPAVVSVTALRNDQETIIGYLLISTDNSLRKIAEERLALYSRMVEKNERFIRSITSNIPGLVSYWDKNLICTYANKAYFSWFGRTPEQMMGISIRELMGDALFRINEPFIGSVLQGDSPSFELSLRKSDGSTGYALASYIPDVQDHEVCGFSVLMSDVTELKTTQMALTKSVDELEILATTDLLTGIGNRRYFFERSEAEILRSIRYDLPLIFLMIDIDHFKSINDTFGHDTGDHILKSLATTAQNILRTTDVLGRIGGEEFGALLIQTGIEEGKHIAERLRKSIQDIVLKTNNSNIRLTVSIGLAVFEGREDSLDAIMKRADVALYKAKESGRNRVCIFVES